MESKPMTQEQPEKTFVCSSCGSDLMQAGFTVQTYTHKRYRAHGGRVASTPEEGNGAAHVYCARCFRPAVDVSAKEIVEAVAA